MLAVTIVFVLLALLGHGAFWVGAVNRLHATGLPRKVVKALTLVSYLSFLGIPLVLLPAARAWHARLTNEESWHAPLELDTGYLAFCAVFGIVHLPLWAFERWRSRQQPHTVRLTGEHAVNLADAIGESPARGPRTRFLAQVPFNQLWELHVLEYDIQLPGLHPKLEGLSICHWSDLHLSGRIDRGYFDQVTRISNTLDADLLVLTGDVCDKRQCMEWIPSAFSDAQARLGKYFILGNHDLRTKDVPGLRRAVEAAGFVDLGGRRETIVDGRIVIAGDERPWFKTPLPALDDVPADVLKVLLAHTPDQLRWAREQGYDLMLAGHTHGGQLRFPVIGPVACPSWHGTRYACGFFYEEPTLMHVSRGTASYFPYRLNCPPEITKLTLRRG